MRVWLLPPVLARVAREVLVTTEEAMRVWLLRHRRPDDAQFGGEVFKLMLVRANNQSEARVLAKTIAPFVGRLELESNSAWGDPGKTTCEDVTEGDSVVLAVEMFGTPGRP